MDFFVKLFDTSDFPARWTCGRWSEGHGWLHIVSDLGVWSAYFAIPLVLGYFAFRRKDLPFRRVFFLFGAFILLCGLTHLMEAIIFWWPAYRLAGLLKLVTAIISWITVLALIPIVPKVLAMRSPEELDREIQARKEVEVKLQSANAELEKRVEERTTKLSEALGSLSEERELLRTTLASIGDGVIVTDHENRVTFLNPVAEQLTGWVTTDASHSPLDKVFNIINEQTHEPVENPAVRAVTQGVIVGLANHTLLISKDGTQRPIDDSAAPIRNKDSTVVGCVLVFRDISERKRVEQEMTSLATESDRQRRLYETVLTNTPDFVYVFSLDHKVLYANDSLIKMWGRGYDGAIGKTFLEIGYEPWHAEMHDREIDQVRATRQPIRGEVPFHGTLGRRQYDYIFVPIIGADGEVEAVAGTTRDVTERVETERKLRESEERSAFVRRSSGVGFWYCDLPFDVLQWDDLVKSHFHLPSDAAVTIQTFYDRIHPDDREPTRLAIEQSIAGRTPYHVDYRTVHPETGAVKWVRAIGRTFYAADGTPTRFDGVTLDVSDQKQAEERQSFLVTLADTLRPLSDPVDVQAEASRLLGEHLGVNRVVYFEIRGDEYVVERDYTAGVQALAGQYPVASFGQDLLADLLTGLTVIEADATTEPDRSSEERAAFAAIQVRGHVDVPLVKGGRFVAGMTVQVSNRRDWTRQEVALIEDTAERTWAVVERVRAEREVARLAADAERERRLFAAVLSNTPDFIYTFDLQGRFVYVNTALLALWGKKLDEAVGRNFFDLGYPPDLAERLQNQIQQVINTKHSLRDETPYTSDRGERMYEYIFAPVLGAGDVVEAVAGSTRDITDRKRTEADLRLLAAELSEAARRKDEFLATLAHELRNPLAPIRNGLQVMRLAGTNGKIEQARTMMERQLTQLVRLVDDLLDASRVTSGKLELRRERVELRAVIDAAIETTRPVIELAGHQLKVVLPDQPILVDGDPTRLAQVISNLLNNSAKYTTPGGHIQLSVSREEDTAVLVVADDGIGIPPDMLGKVFDMFIQVDRALEKTTGGLGIGLSLVKGLVEMHRGTIEARSPGEGRGSEFVVRLPILLPEADNIEPAKEDDRVGATTRRRILVADDNVDSADSLGQLLELLGNEVKTANDGLQAVEVAQSFRPDVILLDIGMPKLNGYETCRRIRDQVWGKHITLIALTGWGQDEDKRKSQEAGFDHHLVKPVDPSVLQKLLAGLQTT